MRTSRRSCLSSAWPNHPTSTVACSPCSHSSALSRLFSFTRILTKVSRFRGASQGATRGRRQATPGDTPGQFVQLEASWSDAKRRPATLRRCLLSSGSQVRILPGALIFAPRNPWRQTVARAGCHSTLHTVFTSSASRPQVMLATLGLSPTPASRAAIAPDRPGRGSGRHRDMPCLGKPPWYIDHDRQARGES